MLQAARVSGSATLVSLEQSLFLAGGGSRAWLGGGAGAVPGKLARLEEVNTLLGFQMLANMITNVVVVIMFGFYTVAGALAGEFYWPFLVIMLTPALRLLLVGHWGQIMKDTVGCCLHTSELLNIL